MAATTETPVRPRSIAGVDSLIWLTLMIAASIALRLALNTRFEAPTILTDELTYSNMARTFASGRLGLESGYGVVYPLLMAPSWAVAKLGTDAYTYMKATNAVLVSLIAIPVFLWARRMMRHGYALLAAGLTLLMPSMAYSGHIMTENAFALFFLIAVWTIAVAVERPTVLHQALLLVALALAFATRAQAVVLLPAVPLIIVIAAFAEQRATGSFAWRGVGRRLVRWWPLAVLAGLGLLAVMARTVLTDWHWNQLLQAYGETANGQYTTSNVSRYFLWHLGEATFALGVIPVAALLTLVGMGILNRMRSAAERAYLCTAIVTIPLVILQVAAFTSYWSQRVSERNMFCVFPVVLIGLALWLDHGLPRTRRTAALAAAIAGILVLSVPFVYLYQRAPSTETWAIVVPEILSRKLAGGADDVQVLIVVGIAIALLAFGVARRDIAIPAIALLLAGYFAMSQVAVVHAVGKAAADYRSIPSLGADASWIDRAVPAGAEVEVLYGGSLGPDAERVLSWQTSFFNKHPLRFGSWGHDLVVDPATGAVSGPDGAPASLPTYVVTPSSFRLAGDVVADRGAFLLVRPSRPYRLTTQSSGFYADGWIAPSAALADYTSRGGESVLHVHLDRANPLAGDAVATATVTVGTLAIDSSGVQVIGTVTGTQQAPVSQQQGAEFDLSAPKGPFLVQITVDPGFRPSDSGSADSRDIGARATLTLDGRGLPG